MNTTATTRKIPEQGNDTQGIVNAKPHDTETNQSTEVVEHDESKRLQAKANISTTLEEGEIPLDQHTKQNLPPCSSPLVSIAEGRGIWIQCRRVEMASCSVTRAQTKVRKENIIIMMVERKRWGKKKKVKEKRKNKK